MNANLWTQLLIAIVPALITGVGSLIIADLCLHYFKEKDTFELLNGKYHNKLHMDILESEFNGDFIRNKNI